jgi:type VI secretion system protein
MSVTFDQQGGSIGRRQENDWVLPDPERFISGRHALIGYIDGAFCLTDTSSNGVFINHAETPLGKDNQATLADGDIIAIGDYEISVSLPADEVLAEPSQDLDNLDDPFAKMAEQHAGDPFGVDLPASPTPDESGEAVAEPVFSLDEPEPSEFVIEEAGEPDQPEPFSQADHTSDLSAYFNQPTPIPEDWNLDEASSGVKSDESGGVAPEILPPSKEQPVSTSPFPQSQPVVQDEPVRPAIPQEPIPQPGIRTQEMPDQSHVQQIQEGAPPKRSIPSDEAALRQSLAEGLGIPVSYLEGLPLSDLLHNLGTVLRASVDGSMSILRARAQMKSEFRMTQTMIQPVENNPLKFSINIEEALRHIVNPSPKSGYLPPLNAIEEAHEDIEAHMLAVMVGMQAALKVVLQRFKPEILEKRLGQSALLERLPLYRNAKTWDLFTELYSQIANEAEDDFHQLFGRSFAHAYEEQIRRLEALKHADPNQN